jgi:hypothetical protein
MTTPTPDRLTIVYVNEYEPWYGVLIKDEPNVERARRAAEAEAGSELPMHYLGIRVEPILHEDGRLGRRRRFHVFTDEP